VSARDRIVAGVRRLLEEQYRESASYQAKRRYAESSECEKGIILGAFLQKQIEGPRAAKRWIELLRDRL
jgi:hypothetical protein